MNDTTLNAYAMEKGINKTTQEMTNQEKIGLAMEMFMEKTAYAAGNYAKENETLAGSLGTAKAALSNFLSGAGTVEDVVSSFSNAANVIVKNIDEMFPKLMTGITQLVEQIVPMIPPLLEKLLPGLISGATSLINGIVSAMPQIVTALMAAVPALIQGITQIVNALIAALPSVMQAFVAALPALLPALIAGLVSMIVTLCTNFEKIIQPIIDSLPDIIISIVDAILANLPALIQGFIQLVAGIVRATDRIWGALIKVIPSVFKSIWNAIKNVFAPVGKWFGDKFTSAKNSIINAWSNVKSKFTSIKNGVVNAFSNIKEKLSAPFKKARDIIKGIADKIKGFFKGNISMPKIKLPHFSVSPKGWKVGDLLKGKLPKLGIDWYARAMNNPMIMNQPTVFGYNSQTGQLMGGGESGSEVISGTNTLMGMIRAAVSAQNEAIEYYLQRLIEMLGAYFPQALAAMDNPRPAVFDPNAAAAALAIPMNKQLGRLSSGKDRGR